MGRVPLKMRRLLCTVLALAFTAGLAGDAAARSGSCLVPGNKTPCKVWSGRVVAVDDGDTILVDVSGDETRARIRVRLTGIQAMESGQCHAPQATARLKQLLRRGGNKVRLAALDPSSASQGRWRRAVAVRFGGRWRDVSRILVSEGHALSLPNSAEYVWNAEYSRLADQAAAKGRNLWSPTYCGAGPSDASPLKSRSTPTPMAPTATTSTASGSGSATSIPSTTSTSAAGGCATPPCTGTCSRTTRRSRRTTASPLYVGSGTSTWTDFYWRSRKPIFDNIAGHDMGDGAYLFDMQGDLRASMTYPCRIACADPNQGAITISAHPSGREYVTLRNVTSGPVDLQNYRLETPPYAYAFGRDALLGPGEAMTIDVRGEPAQDTGLHKYWGKTGAILNNGGDKLRLATFRGVVIGCYAYGTARC